MLQSENKDHLGPVEAGAGTELGNKNMNMFNENSTQMKYML